MKALVTSRLIIDQALWTLTNFALVVLVARLASPDSFGLFALAYSSVVLVTGLVNVLAGEVLGVTRGVAMRGGRAEPPIHAAQLAFGVVVAMALIAPAAALVAVLVFGGAHTPAASAWALICVAPAAVMAEGNRSLAYGLRRTDTVLRLSLMRFSTQVIIVVLLIVSDAFKPHLVVLAWGVGGLVAVVMDLIEFPLRPRFFGATKAEWKRRRHFGFEYIATSGPSQGMVFFAGAALGLPAAGSIRALQSLYGPLNVLSMGIRKVVIPIVAEDPSKVRRVGLTLSVGAGGIALLGTAVLLLIPGLGGGLLGASWPTDLWLVGGFGAGRVAVGIVLGALIVLRAYDQGSYSSRLRALSAASLLIPFALGSLVDLRTAMWAAGVASIFAAFVWWWFAFRMAQNDPTEGRLQ